jgi:hypothetical protein
MPPRPRPRAGRRACGGADRRRLRLSAHVMPEVTRDFYRDPRNTASDPWFMTEPVLSYLPA